MVRPSISDSGVGPLLAGQGEGQLGHGPGLAALLAIGAQPQPIDAVAARAQGVADAAGLVRAGR